LFVRPLAAPSFGAFWRRWNAPYGYVLLYFAYRPLRRHLRPALATCCAFLASGFFLHDCIANGGDLLRGQVALPATLLFATFGAMVLLGEAFHIDLSAPVYVGSPDSEPRLAGLRLGRWLPNPALSPRGDRRTRGRKKKRGTFPGRASQGTSICGKD
jgi:hypothetical protein